MAKVIRFLCAPDNHGHLVDRSAAKVFFEFCKTFQPTVRIHTGDCFDFTCLRRGAGPEEIMEDLREDLDMGMDFMRRLKPTHWLRGNHDERLVDGINSHNPVLSRFASMAWTEILESVKGAQIFPYCKRRGILKMGSLCRLPTDTPAGCTRRSAWRKFTTTSFLGTYTSVTRFRLRVWSRGWAGLSDAFAVWTIRTIGRS